MLHARHAVIGAGLLGATPAAFAATAFAGPTVAGIPVEFILFACALLGVALFHHHTLPIALGRRGRDHALQDRLLAVSGRAPASAGFVAHLAHEWVIARPTCCCCCSVSRCSRDHFEESRVPDVLPRFLPDDWKGGFVLLAHRVRAVELPRQHRRRDDRRRHRAHACSAARCTSATSRRSSPRPTPAAPAASSATRRRR